MSDLINRQDAITIPVLPVSHRKYQTMNLDDAYELGWLDCQKCIENLPSAQPEIVRCKDCAAYGEMLTGRDTRMICHKFALNFPRDFYCADAERRTDE